MRLSGWMSIVAVTLSACGGTTPTGGAPDGGGGADGGGGVDAGHDAGTVTQVAPFPIEDACEVIRSSANFENKPVDIIVVIDNSSSMTAEIVAVESNINQSFAQILDSSGLDYRVILVAKHGSASSNQSVCIRQPLSGTSCDPLPSAPVFGTRFFQYDLEIGSNNPLERLIFSYSNTNTLNSTPWRSWLREGSFKTFIAITDDEANITADKFETDLFALTPAGTFGSAEKRQYVMHSIVGIVANDPPSAPWPATAAKQNTKCSSAANPSAVYEDLSIRTGGLRFPVCETSSYDAVFQAAAQQVIESAELACDFQAPVPTDGTTFQDSYIEYTPGSGAAVEYLRAVPEGGSCSPNHYQVNYETGRITLCPEACTRLMDDQNASVAVAYACGVTIE